MGLCGPQVYPACQGSRLSKADTFTVMDSQRTIQKKKKTRTAQMHWFLYLLVSMASIDMLVRV